MTPAEPLACAVNTVPLYAPLLATALRATAAAPVVRTVADPSDTYHHSMHPHAHMLESAYHRTCRIFGCTQHIRTSNPTAETVRPTAAVNRPDTVVAPLINAVPVTDNEPVTVTSPSPRTLNFSDEESSA